MILTCPACGTQYAVKDGAIPPGGRQVRCAACKHSWHQDPEGDPDATESGQAPSGEDEVADSGSTTQAQPAEPETDADAGASYGEVDDYGYGADASGEPSEEPADALAVSDADEPAMAPLSHEEEAAESDEFNPFAAAEDAEEPRRSPLRPIFILLLLLALLGAAFWFFAPPEWKARVGLAEAGDTPLQLMMTYSGRQPLASGNELLAVTGRVINPTDEDQPVPPIQAQLRSKSGQLVYSWTIAPPARTLPPGASATFNSAEVNVPSGGDELTISLGAPRA